MSLAKKKILIVDDEEPVRRTLREALELMGYVVQEAADGETALEAFRQSPPELIITDIYMRGMSGIHLLRTIRRENKEAKVILMTAQSHYEQLLQDEKSQPNGFFTKPFPTASVIRLIEELIGEE